MSNKPRAYRQAQKKKEDEKSMRNFYLIAILITLIGLTAFYFVFFS